MATGTFKDYLSEKIDGDIQVENVIINHNHFKLFEVNVDETFDGIMCNAET